MSREKNQREVASLLGKHGRTYAEEAGISVDDSPAVLFQLLVLATMLSARIRAEAAVEAMRGLLDSGLNTAAKLAAAGWDRRVKILNGHGYARYDESTARMLGDTCETLAEKYGGDLRKLREAAGRDVGEERRLLQEFKGIGELGASIFLREVQGVWDEVYPFADDRVLEEAARRGLPKTAAGLAHYVNQEDFPRLVAALLRAKTAS